MTLYCSGTNDNEREQLEYLVPLYLHLQRIMVLFHSFLFLLSVTILLFHNILIITILIEHYISTLISGFRISWAHITSWCIHSSHLVWFHILSCARLNSNTKYAFGVNGSSLRWGAFVLWVKNEEEFWYRGGILEKCIGSKCLVSANPKIWNLHHLLHVVNVEVRELIGQKGGIRFLPKK